MHRGVAHEREHRRGIVARLLQQAVEGDRASVESRRRARLQPADGQLEFTQLCRERFRGRITGPARLVVLEADVDQSG